MPQNAVIARFGRERGRDEIGSFAAGDAEVRRFRAGFDTAAPGGNILQIATPSRSPLSL